MTLRISLKPRKCKQCGEIFQRRTTTQTVCGPKCAEANAAKVRAQKEARAAKTEKKSMRERIEKAKTRGEHLKELQAAFNAWVRHRDAGRTCISCGRHHRGQLHAGHYRSVGSCPELRFEPDNVHLTCQPCNVHLSGNLIQMRIGMIKKIGLTRVEWIEGHHEPKKYTLAEIQDMKVFYRAEVRRLKREAA